jgi:hypothetical protein
LIRNTSEHFPSVGEPGSVEDLEVEGNFKHRGKLEFGSDVGAAHDTHVHVVSAEIALHFVIARLFGALIDDGVCGGRRALDITHGDETLTVSVSRNDEGLVDVGIPLSANGESSVVVSANGADGTPRSLGAHLNFDTTIALGVVCHATSVVADTSFESSSELILPVELIGGFDQTVGTSAVLADLINSPIVPELQGLEEPHFEFDGLVASSIHPVTTSPGDVGASKLIVVELRTRGRSICPLAASSLSLSETFSADAVVGVCNDMRSRLNFLVLFYSVIHLFLDLSFASH